MLQWKPNIVTKNLSFNLYDAFHFAFFPLTCILRTGNIRKVIVYGNEIPLSWTNRSRPVYADYKFLDVASILFKMLVVKSKSSILILEDNPAC